MVTDIIEGYKSTEIGKIPSDWDLKIVEEISSVTTGNKDTQNKSEDGKYDFYVRSQKIEKIDSYSFDGEAVLTAGDGVGVGKVFHYVKGKFDFHQRVYKVSDFKNIDGKFFFYYFSENFMKEARKYNSKTSVDSVRRHMITEMKIPIPPILEQLKIVEILTVADEQIEKTEQLIEKTKELKKGLMQQLLTKGIGHSEFKETELGSIPCEWIIVEINDVFQTIDGDRGKNYPNDKDFLSEGYCVFLDTKNVTKKGFSFKTKKFISKEKDDSLSNGKLSRNDIVMTSRGTIGNIAYYDKSIPYENLRINSAMLILRSKAESLVYKFWIQMLRGKIIEEYIRKSQVGSAQPHITKKSFKELKVAIPKKIEEQQKIAAILSSVDEQIETYEKEKQKQVDLKKALIQQLLTGKLRVTV